MLKKTIVVIFTVTFVLTSCVPSATLASTQIPTTPIPPAVTTTTPSASTPRPAATLKQDAALYAGPGNVDFDITASLKTGTVVFPLGTYGDFVQAAAIIDSREITGFIWKEALDSLPASLPVLAADQVPLNLFVLPQCSPGSYDSAQDAVTFSNPGNNWSVPESNAFPLAAPLEIEMAGMQVSGATSPNITVLSKVEPPTANWWEGITRMDVGSKGGFYTIGIMDGRTGYATLNITLPLKTDQGIRIIFDQPEGRSFHILDGAGKEIRTVDLTTRTEVNLPNGLFANGVVYVDLGLPPKTTLTVKGLRIGVAPSGAWSEDRNGYYSQPGLTELAARRGLTFGTEFNNAKTIDKRYCRTMKRDFGIAVLSEFSSPDLWLGPGQYDFTALDKAVDYAAQHGWRIRASHLLWGGPPFLPDWLKNSNYPRDEYIRIMEQYIRDIVGRYKGRVQEWSIANEASIRFYGTGEGSDFWNIKIGPEYIPLAFKTAREADPNGILIFNDDNNQSPQDQGSRQVIDIMYATVKRLKADGVPIDVVGMEMHFFEPWNSQVMPKKTDVIATMQRFAALGVRIYITELTVNLSKVKGTQAEKLDAETKIYKEMMEACLESDVCDSFSTWGINDPTPSGNNPAGAPLMFDASFIPKPAYFAVRDALLRNPADG
jgi:endo-1,4-beta-xylanase